VGTDRITARVGRNKRSALRRIVFEPSGINMANVPIAIRPVTASPNPPYVNLPYRKGISCAEKS